MNVPDVPPELIIIACYLILTIILDIFSIR
jgi:hypothetical protein